MRSTGVITPVSAFSAGFPRQPKADRCTIFILVILSILTISSSGVLLFGMPRITLISIPFTFYMLVKLSFRLQVIFTRFSLIYLAAFTLGTLNALATPGELKALATIQFLMALLTFATLASYFTKWLLYRPDKKKKRDLELVLIAFFLFSLFELFNYTLVANLRLQFYNSAMAALVGEDFILRELGLYGGRPTGFFSETSHFARFIGLVIAAYMMVTRCSLRSLLTFAVFLVALRSVSFFFAAPAMAVAIISSIHALKTPSGTLTRKAWRRIVIFSLVSFLTIVIVGTTQSERIFNALNPTTFGGGNLVSGDGSLNARLLFPLAYLLLENDSPIIGKGLTPQDAVQNYTLNMKAFVDRTPLAEEHKEGIAASIVMLAGLGYVGVGILFFGLLLLTGKEGMILLLSFVAANAISSGYHSVASLVPSALLLSLVFYGRRFGSRAV